MSGMVSNAFAEAASVAVATVARVVVVGALFTLAILAAGGTVAVAQTTTTTPSTIPDVCDPGPDAPDDPIPDACTANRALPHARAEPATSGWRVGWT